MDNKRREAHLNDVDRVLADVREHLDFGLEQGEEYELRALQLLLEVTKSMHTIRDIRELMVVVLDSVLAFAEADRAFLLLMNGGDQPRFKMGRTYSRDYLTEDDCIISHSVIDEAITCQEPVILTDAQSDPRFGTRQSIIDLDLRTIMAAPLRCDDAVLGLIYVDSRRPLTRYSKHHLNVLSSLADQAAVALRNAQKFDTHTGDD